MVNDLTIPTFADLPPVPMTLTAEASTTQSTTKTTITPPKGLSSQVFGIRDRTMDTPRRRATGVSYSTSLSWNFDAFFAANGLITLHDNESPTWLLKSHQAELEASSLPPTSCGSMPPRACSVTALVPQPVSASAVHVLNVLAHIASHASSEQAKAPPIAAGCRFQYLVGEDADAFSSSNLQVEDKDESRGIRLTLCYMSHNKCQFEKSSTLDVTSDETALMRSVQQILVMLFIQASQDMPPGLSRSLSAVPPDAFRSTRQKTASLFFEQLKSQPHCTRSSYHRSCEDQEPLAWPKIFVRIFPICAGGAGIAQKNVIHGLLVCGSSSIEAEDHALAKYLRRCERASRDQLTGSSIFSLLPPSGAREVAIGLHVLAVHAEPHNLGNLVTLYGKGGRPGGTLPTSLRISEAIRPLEDVLQQFFVIPCKEESVLPSIKGAAEKGLHFATMSCLEDAVKTFKGEFGEGGKRFHCFLDHVPATAAAAEAAFEEVFVQTALGFSLSNARMTNGEALAELSMRSPTKLTTMFERLIRDLGTECSVQDSFDFLSELLEKHQNPAGGVEDVPVSAAPSKPASITAAGMNRVLEVMGIDFEANGQTIQISDHDCIESIEAKSICKTIYKLSKLIRSTSNFQSAVDRCVGKDVAEATKCALVEAAGQASDAAFFAVVVDEGGTGDIFEARHGGKIFNASANEILSSEWSRVVIAVVFPEEVAIGVSNI